MEYPPDDLTLDCLQWLRRDYPSLTGHPLTDRDIAVWVCGSMGYVSCWQTNPMPDPLVKHEQCKATVLKRIQDIVNPPAPPVTGDSIAPLQGYTRLVGPSFGDDTGPRRLQFCTYFAFFRIFRDDRDEALRQLDRIMGHWQGLRVAWNLGGTPWDSLGLSVSPDWPNYDAIIRDGLQACWDRGLRVMMTNCDLYHRPEKDWPIVYDRVASLCASVNQQVVSLSSVINEAFMTSPWREDWPRYADYSRIWQAKYPWGQHGLSCPATQEDPEGLKACAIPPATVALLQGTRWSGPDAIRRAFNVRYEGLFKPLWEEEPTGIGKDVYQSTTDFDTLLGIYSMKVFTGQALTLLNDPALYNRQPLDSTWGFREIPALWKQMELPENTGQWALKPLHHVDAPITASGVNRMDSVTDGKQSYGVASGGSNWQLGPVRWDCTAQLWDHTGVILEKSLKVGQMLAAIPGQPTPKIVRLIRA